jgi:hypothetical protein
MIGLFVEDDIVLSRYALQYIRRSVSTFLIPAETESPEEEALRKSLMGVSLYSPHHNDVLHKVLVCLLYDWINSFTFLLFFLLFPSSQLLTPKEMEGVTNPYLWQYPHSWGVVYTVEGWVAFRSFITDWLTDPSTATVEPNITNSKTNTWPSIRSWKKYMIRYMVDRELQFLYPTVSYSKNDPTLGSNLQAKWLPYFTKIYGTRLLEERIANASQSEEDFRLPDSDPWKFDEAQLSKLSRFDVYRKRVTV